MAVRSINSATVQRSVVMPAATGGVARIVPCFVTKLYAAKYKPSAASWFSGWRLKALVRRVNRRICMRIETLSRSTCDVQTQLQELVLDFSPEGVLAVAAASNVFEEGTRAGLDPALDDAVHGDM